MELKTIKMNCLEEFLSFLNELKAVKPESKKISIKIDVRLAVGKESEVLMGELCEFMNSSESCNINIEVEIRGVFVYSNDLKKISCLYPKCGRFRINMPEVFEFCTFENGKLVFLRNPISLGWRY